MHYKQNMFKHTHTERERERERHRHTHTHTHTQGSNRLTCVALLISLIKRDPLRQTETDIMVISRGQKQQISRASAHNALALCSAKQLRHSHHHTHTHTHTHIYTYQLAHAHEYLHVISVSHKLQ